MTMRSKLLAKLRHIVIGKIKNGYIPHGVDRVRA
jgi:protein required for attachment to host cells